MTSEGRPQAKSQNVNGHTPDGDRVSPNNALHDNAGCGQKGDSSQSEAHRAMGPLCSNSEGLEEERKNQGTKQGDNGKKVQASRSLRLGFSPPSNDSAQLRLIRVLHQYQSSQPVTQNRSCSSVYLFVGGQGSKSE